MKLVRPRPLHSVHITLPHPSHSGHGSAGICSAGTRRKGLGRTVGRFALAPLAFASAAPSPLVSATARTAAATDPAPRPTRNGGAGIAG